MVFSHPAIPGRSGSAEYRVKLNGVEVYLPAILGFAGGTAAFLPFDMNGPVEVEVWADRNFDKAEVHPLSAGIDCVREGNTIRFTLDTPRNIFIKWDDGFELPLYLWASPVQQDVPEPNALGVQYFGPGVHEDGEINLKSGDHLYLAPGALVYGHIYAEDAENIRVSGRGILCASKVPTHHGPRHEMVGFVRCRNVRVEGIVLLDSWGWTLVFRNCDNVRVDGVRLLCERCFSTDGINPCNCRDVRIENSFVRCKDDCVSIKGLDAPSKAVPEDKSEWSPIQDITVENCVFWSDNNNGIVVGTETRASVIERIVFRNIDLVKCSNTCGDVAGAMAVISLHDTEISDILFEDIRIEHSTGPWFNCFFTDSIFGIPGMRCPWGGSIRNITLRNISISGGPLRPAYLRGCDQNHAIENVRVEGLCVFGKEITEPRDARFVIGEFVAGFAWD